MPRQIEARTVTNVELSPEQTLALTIAQKGMRQVAEAASFIGKDLDELRESAIGTIQEAAREAGRAACANGCKLDAEDLLDYSAGSKIRFLCDKVGCNTTGIVTALDFVDTKVNEVVVAIRKVEDYALPEEKK